MSQKTLDSKFMELLACPACDDRPPLSLGEDGASLQCAQCGRRYPIVDGIPVLLVDHAILPEPAN